MIKGYNRNYGKTDMTVNIYSNDNVLCNIEISIIAWGTFDNETKQGNPYFCEELSINTFDIKVNLSRDFQYLDVKLELTHLKSRNILKDQLDSGALELGAQGAHPIFGPRLRRN